MTAGSKTFVGAITTMTRTLPASARRGWLRFATLVSELLPKGLYARALIIIIAPIVVLEGVVAFVFMERHWQAVTRRLSEQTARNVSALIEIYEGAPTKAEQTRLIELARERLNLTMQVLPAGDLPAARPKPFFNILDRALSREISKYVQRPFWIDTVGQSRHVEIRVATETSIIRFIATRSQTYASNSEIFLLWMVGSSVILLTVAILFLRNRSGRFCASPKRRTPSARGGRCRTTSGRAARARCARPPKPSSRCATASSSTSSSGPPCSPASVTISEPC